MESKDIALNDTIIIYDHTIIASARLRFLFKLFNKTNDVFIINGGLNKWKE